MKRPDSVSKIHEIINQTFGQKVNFDFKVDQSIKDDTFNPQFVNEFRDKVPEEEHVDSFNMQIIEEPTYDESSNAQIAEQPTYEDNIDAETSLTNSSLSTQSNQASVKRGAFKPDEIPNIPDVPQIPDLPDIGLASPEPQISSASPSNSIDDSNGNKDFASKSLEAMLNDIGVYDIKEE